MPAQRYFPQVEADRSSWLNNYAAKITEHGLALGLNAEEIAATAADCAYYVWVLHTWNPAIQHDAQQATAYKNLIATGSGADAIALPAVTVFAEPPAAVPPGVLNRLFNQVQRLKLHPAYSEGIGRDLGTLTLASKAEHSLPTFTASSEHGPKGRRVRIDYTKHGHDGVVIESRIGNGAWLPLGNFTQKPTYDERPLAVAGTPENRDYRMRWWDKDAANGEWSAVQTVLLGG